MEARTVIGVFDNRANAERAVDKLVEWGFTREHVEITSDTEAIATALESDTARERRPHEDRIGSRISHFFSRLFGGESPHEDAHYYSEAVRRGSVMVTVLSGSEEGADSAADILNDCGAIDVEEHERQFRETGWQGSPASTVPTSGTRDTTQPGERDTVMPEESDFAKRRRDKGGVRIYTHLGESPVQETPRRTGDANVDKSSADRTTTGKSQGNSDSRNQ